MALSDLYTTEGLIANIKRRCSVPTSQLTYTPEDFALLATDTLQGEVVPLIMSTREEFFVDYYETNFPASGEIEFPDDTVASKLRSVCYVQQTRPLLLINLPRLDLDVVAGASPANLTTVAGFYLQGNKLMLYPNNAVPTGTTLRIYFYKRVLVLATPSQYGKVSSVDTNTNEIVLDVTPSEWVTGTVLNSILPTSPFNATNAALTVVSVSSPTVTLDTVTGVSVGDYVSAQGYSAIPQVPIEAQAYLAQLTAAKCLEGLGNRAGMEAALAKAQVLKENLLVMISQRVDGSVKKVINPTGGLRLGAGLGYWYGGTRGNY